MSKYLIRSAMVVSIAAAVFALAVPVRAEDQAPNGAASHRPGHYSGTIESINAAASTFTVKNVHGETETFSCDDASRFNFRGPHGISHGTLTDLKVGDQASVTYTESDGKLVCRTASCKRMQPPSKTLSGTIESIDAAAGTVTVKNSGGETKTFICYAVSKIRPTTRWQGTLKDLTIGDDATVTYIETDGKLVCQHLVSQKPAPPEPKTAEVKAEPVVAPPVIHKHQYQFQGYIKSIDEATLTVTLQKDWGGISTVTLTCAADCEFETNGGMNKHLALSDMNYLVMSNMIKERIRIGVAALCTDENGKFVCYKLVGQQELTP